MDRFLTIKNSIEDMISFNLLARILNIVKASLLAFYVGANYSMDSYLLAFSATMLVTTMIAEGITISLVPTLQQVDKRDGFKGRVDLTNNAINYFFLIGLILTGVGLVGAPFFVKFLGPGFKGEELKETISLFRLGIPIIGLHFIRAVCGGYLQSDHKFKAGAKSAVANSLVYISYLLLVGNRLGLRGLMLAGLVAVVAQIFVMMQALVKSGYSYKLYYNPDCRTLKRVRSFLIPVTLGIGINELNSAADNAVASLLGKGIIAELSYASEITNLLSGLLILAIVTAVFPILAENYNDMDMDEFRANIRFSLKLLLLVILPLSLLLIYLSYPIIQLVYGRGEFSSVAIAETAGLLKFYAMGLLGIGLQLLVVRIYYATHDTRTPMILSIFILISNLILNLSLGKVMGGGGIALASSVSVTIASLIGLYHLNRRIGFVRVGESIGYLFIIFIALIVMLIGGFAIERSVAGLYLNPFVSSIFKLVLAGGLGLVIYGNLMYFMLKDK